jgi:hypothetical protein
MDYPAGEQKRELRVSGTQTTWRGLLSILETVTGTSYKIVEHPVFEANEKEEAARRAGDEGTEMTWSAAGLVGLGGASVPDDLDNDRFDFRPETAETTLTRLYGKK